MQFGPILSATIALDPPQFADRGDQETRECPLCGEAADDTDRLAATLHPTFAREISLGLPVWVHRACFDRCPDAGKCDHVPG